MPEAAVSHLPAPKPSPEPQTSTGEHDGKTGFQVGACRLYNPKNSDWEVVDVPAMNFLMVDGNGDPNTAKDYSDAVEAL